MGQEFCKGCEDCTNFKNSENNLSYFANKPIQNLNNPFFDNGPLDNSMLNKTDFQNDTSFLTNYNNNLINQNKNDISSLKPTNNELNANLIINNKYYQRESEDIFKEKNDNEEKNNLNHNMNDITNNKNNNQNISDDDQERLEEIHKNYGIRIITKYFRQMIEKKRESHKVIYTEYDSIKDINYFGNNTDVNLVPEKKYLYIGTKFKNEKDGLGLELFLDSNAKYFGLYKNNKRVSICRFKINNDNYSYYYNGEIKGIYANGFGYYENYKESIFYEGMWANSKKEGYGIEINNKDNSIYKGYFYRGKKEGIGTYSWSDNSSYYGEWSGGLLNGYGIYHFQDGSIYNGHWENNKMNGLGEFTFPEIKTYFGYFERDKRTGFGILIWYKENKVFIGFWKDNKQNGLGKFINNGKIRYGLWENGNLKEKIKNEENFNNKLRENESNYLCIFKYNSYEVIVEIIKRILTL